MTNIYDGQGLFLKMVNYKEKLVSHPWKTKLNYFKEPCVDSFNNLKLLFKIGKGNSTFAPPGPLWLPTVRNCLGSRWLNGRWLAGCCSASLHSGTLSDSLYNSTGCGCSCLMGHQGANTIPLLSDRRCWL